MDTKLTGLTLTLTALLSACSSDSNSNSNSQLDSDSTPSLSSPTLTLTNENTKYIVSYLSEKEDFISDRSAKSIIRNQGIVARNDSELLDDSLCISGSITYVQLDTGTKQIYDNCVFDDNEANGGFSLLYDGSINILSESSIIDDTLTYTLTVESDNFKSHVTKNDKFYTTITDGVEITSSSLGNANIFSEKWDFLFYIDTNFQNNLSGTVQIKTAVDIEQTDESFSGNNSTFPLSGEYRINGGNDTYANVTIISNGHEVSVNGGQPILYTWDDLKRINENFFSLSD